MRLGRPGNKAREAWEQGKGGLGMKLGRLGNEAREAWEQG